MKLTHKLAATTLALGLGVAPAVALGHNGDQNTQFTSTTETITRTVPVTTNTTETFTRTTESGTTTTFTVTRPVPTGGTTTTVETITRPVPEKCGTKTETSTTETSTTPVGQHRHHGGEWVRYETCGHHHGHHGLGFFWIWKFFGPAGPPTTYTGTGTQTRPTFTRPDGPPTTTGTTPTGTVTGPQGPPQHGEPGGPGQGF